MRFAYADPPYPGQARRHYGAEAAADGRRAREVNHGLLVAYLEEFDGWALSTSSVALRDVLAVCPADVRVGSWVKPFASFKPGVNPGYCWEPVIFRGGRKRGREEPTVRDFVSANITLRKGVSGAKPTEFCWWIFDLLGVTADDEFVDVFPGSGAVTDALDGYLGRLPSEPGTLWAEVPV